MSVFRRPRGKSKTTQGEARTNKDYPYSSLSKEELYGHLNVVDIKCSALLQLSGIILTVGAGFLIAGGTQRANPTLLASLAVFLIVAFLALSIIRLRWSESTKYLSHMLWSRTTRYNICVYLTYLGLGLIALTIILKVL